MTIEQQIEELKRENEALKQRLAEIPASVSRQATIDRLNAMSPEEINANWDQVQADLATL